ncbi:MAG: chromate efflux transporter [Magnetococcales bacterium]|nr:chromate efflux transporter [Magnetococcales bacterium]
MDDHPDQTAQAIPLGEALLYWLKLGFISFGGPAGQIAMMHHELVERRRWISEHRFLHALNYCMLLPGPEAIQLAIYIGWLMHGLLGGVMAGILFFLPSFFILVGLSWVYLALGHLTTVAGVLYGIKPAVIAIVLFAAWRIGSKALSSKPLYAFAASAFLAIFVFDVPFPWIVLVAGLAGYVGGQKFPDQFKAGGGGHGSSGKDYGPAIIGDHTPTPAHARFSWPRVVRFVAAGLAIWLISMLLLVAHSGWQGTMAQLGWFFTKAAMLTIGGAYAVLPYVYQGAVDHYHWLTGVQMIDGLALGETTPGPLIMVVTYVGYVAGWTKALFGSDSLAWSGLVAAAIATWFTFLPSFIFILVGGPIVESTHNEIKFTAPLTGITAAVVGVIVNLALFFAWHALWPQGHAEAPFSGRFEWLAAVMAIASFVALWRYKIGIIPVIGSCAAIGLGYALLG